MKEEKMLTAIRVQPGKAPEIIKIRNTLKAFQDEVGGFIEPYLLPFGDVMILNDDGKNMGLPVNKILLDRYGATLDYFVGTVLIVASNGIEFGSLSKESQSHWLKVFSHKTIYIYEL